MIKAILFDADGVLINGPMFSEYLARDYDITQDDTKTFFTGVFKDCVTGKADLKEVLPPYLKEWGWKKSVDEFIEYWHTVEHTINQDLVKYIQDLRKKGIKCYLATNQTKYRFEYILKEMEFNTFFDKCYVSAQLGYRKPDMDFYRKVMKDLEGIERKEVLFWDDTPQNIAAAKEFGMHAELYTSVEDFKQRMDTYRM
jgi:putative hydrolase of the HAD superfamily